MSKKHSEKFSFGGRGGISPRERLETTNERVLAREKGKKRARMRIFATICGFLVVFGLVFAVGFYLFVWAPEETSENTPEEVVEISPSVLVFDEELGTEAVLTTRMREYIVLTEADFQELGYQVLRVVLPTNSVREMDFYLENVPGYLKLILDRDPGVSVEDADRMLKYLKEQGVAEFSYVDVRLEGRAYWK